VSALQFESRITSGIKSKTFHFIEYFDAVIQAADAGYYCEKRIIDLGRPAGRIELAADQPSAAEPQAGKF
jgi:hypothetical protein